MMNEILNRSAKWALKSSKEQYHSPYVKVFDDVLTLPSRKRIVFTRIELKDFVAVIPVLKRKIVMVKVHRYPFNQWSLEVPCGNINENEPVEKCALRELREETGYIARKITSLGWYYPHTRSTQKSYIFLAEKFIKDKPKHDETEQIKTHILPVKTVYKRLESGKITHAPTIIALYKLMTHRPQLQKMKRSKAVHTKPSANL